jgi:hypothetical protein
MDHNQYIVLALANVPTIIAVLIGFLINNGRLADMNGRLTDMSARIGSVESRMTNLENKFDTRFDLLISKVVEIDNRLIRLEAQRH